MWSSSNVHLTTIHSCFKRATFASRLIHPSIQQAILVSQLSLPTLSLQLFYHWWSLRNAHVMTLPFSFPISNARFTNPRIEQKTLATQLPSRSLRATHRRSHLCILVFIRQRSPITQSFTFPTNNTRYATSLSLYPTRHARLKIFSFFSPLTAL